LRSLRSRVLNIALRSIKKVNPKLLLNNILINDVPLEKVFLLAVGKAAWGMADTAKKRLGDRITDGIVLTNYGNSRGIIPGLEVYEAGHPLPDENSIKVTDLIVEKVLQLTDEDHIIFLLSGGGSSLFESPLEGVSLTDIRNITGKLLLSGADINELNIIRKHVSSVKGGRFAKIVPCKITAYILSDVIGDKLNSIASGPVTGDDSTSEQAEAILTKYEILVSKDIKRAIGCETPEKIDNTIYSIIGNNRLLCESAAVISGRSGFKPYMHPLLLSGEARIAGNVISRIAREVKLYNKPLSPPCAIIMGGETTVKVKGSGKGGRNQELLVAAAKGITDLDDVVILSIASDGIDGPTDAAGGIIDGSTYRKINSEGFRIEEVLAENNSYEALKACNSLILTDPTGTNVNDMVIILVR